MVLKRASTRSPPLSKYPVEHVLGVLGPSDIKMTIMICRVKLHQDELSIWRTKLGRNLANQRPCFFDLPGLKLVPASSASSR
jgi:hypothetical protein